MKRETIVKLNWVGGIVAVILIGICIQGFQVQADQSNTTSTTTESSAPQNTTPIQPAPSSPVPTYHGYSCSSDCSGHEAGYEWAEENDLCDTEYDGGNSESFAEGVRSWAEENCDSSSDDEYYDEDYDYSY